MFVAFLGQISQFRVQGFTQNDRVKYRHLLSKVIQYQLVLFSNRKLHTAFLLVQNLGPSTAQWPSLCVISHNMAALRANYLKFTSTRPLLSMTIMLSRKSFLAMHGLWGMTRTISAVAEPVVVIIKPLVTVCKPAIYSTHCKCSGLCGSVDQ